MLSWKEFNKNTDFEYICKNRATRLRMYKNYLKEEKMKDLPPAVCTSAPAVCTTTGWTVAKIANDSYGHTHSLGTCEAATSKKIFWGVKQEEGNNPMNYATATVQAGTTETQDQRKYLSNRLENVYYGLREPLYAQFGLTDDRAPSTPKELKQRIADGKFVIKGIKDVENEDDEDDFFYGSWPNMIRWRDPAVKADHDGYAAATKELEGLRQKTLDIIKIKSPEDGLKAIEDLESWKPTGAAN